VSSVGSTTVSKNPRRLGQAARLSAAASLDEHGLDGTPYASRACSRRGVMPRCSRRKRSSFVSGTRARREPNRMPTRLPVSVQLRCSCGPASKSRRRSGSRLAVAHANASVLNACAVKRLWRAEARQHGPLPALGRAVNQPGELPDHRVGAGEKLPPLRRLRFDPTCGCGRRRPGWS
jgi:hypothetical protein